jgi:transcriptional regulator with XRE-family HTH domain
MTVTESPSASLANRLREIRLQHELSEADTAALLDTAEKRVSDWESGVVQPSLGTLVLYAAVFNTTVSKLLQGVL